MPTEALCHHCGHAVLSGARFCQHCGSDVSQEQGQIPTLQWTASRPTGQATALDLLRQDTLGEFEILAELGRGGMATVYLAHDIPLDRKVAIKVMSAALMDEGLAERFRREARTAAALNHPHIIPVYAVRERSGLLYFVMKYIPGQSLDPIVKGGVRVSIPMAHIILAQAAAALGYAHRRGVIHRDVKPANIMLDDEGWVVMTDFGIAKVATATGLTMTGVTVGTPAYMSPEQCAGKEVTGASDQYSLGVLAYELITGQKPFTATTAMAMMYSHFNDTPAPLRSLRPDCPASLEEKVMRMLAKSPEDRWPSIEEIFGAPSLAHDDPTRHALVALALSNPNAAIGRLSTPTSPVPPARRSAAATTFPMQSQGATGLFGSPTPTGLAPGRTPVPRPVASHLGGIAIGVTAAAALAVAGYFAVSGRARQPAQQQEPPTVSQPAIDTPLNVDTTTRAAAPPPSEPAPQPQPEAPVRATPGFVRASTSAIDLEVGKSAAVGYQVFDTEGKVMRQHPPITWRSTATRIVSVGREGVVRGIAAGSARVIGTVGGKADTIDVRVSAPAPVPPAPVVVPEPRVVAPPAVATVGLPAQNTPLKVGESATLAASVRDARGDALTDRTVSWESSDPAVASVVNGTVTARGAGSATITATVEGRSASTRVTVVAPVDPAAERARATNEIRANLTAFAAALSRRSMTELQAVSNLPASEEAGWNKMVSERSLRELNAEFELVGTPRIEENSATQEVKLKLRQVFSGRPSSTYESKLTARFDQVGGKWQLVSLQ